MSTPHSICTTSSSTYTVAHPLHRSPTISCQVSQTTLTPTKGSRHLASPTTSNSGPRTPPVVSPVKKSRKSRVVFDFSTEEMAKYFHMSQREAAQQLGVATVTIKRNCRRLGIVWPYRLMKSKKNAINWSTISLEDAQRIRQERALERAIAGRSLASHKRSQAPEVFVNTVAAKITSHSQAGLTEAGRAFARLPLDCQED